LFDYEVVVVEQEANKFLLIFNDGDYLQPTNGGAYK